MTKIVLFESASETGQELIRQALLRGHYVVALTSNPKCISVTHPRLFLAQGEVDDPHFLRGAIGDSGAAILVSDDSIVSSLDKIHAVEAQLIIEALGLQGVRRFVSSLACGASSYLSFFSFIRHFFLPTVLHKSIAREADLLEEMIINSELDWTMLRHPRLINGAQTSQYFITTICLLKMRSKLTRADLVAAMLNQLSSEKFLRKAPYIYE